ncbi:MAG: hypothetical protein ACFCVB_16840 [Nodosilinea sp.]
MVLPALHHGDLARSDDIASSAALDGSMAWILGAEPGDRPPVFLCFGRVSAIAAADSACCKHSRSPCMAELMLSRLACSTA